jgi:hypothetical protein
MKNPGFDHQFARRLRFALLAVVSLTLTGCLVPPSWRNTNPPSTENVLQPHESWCYQTMADIQCYARPQEGLEEALVNVDPQSRRPMTPEEYNKAVGQSR